MAPIVLYIPEISALGRHVSWLSVVTNRRNKTKTMLPFTLLTSIRTTSTSKCKMEF